MALLSLASPRGKEQKKNLMQEAVEKWSDARRAKLVPAKAGIQINTEAYTVRRSDAGHLVCVEAGGLPRFARNKRRRWPFVDSL